MQLGEFATEVNGTRKAAPVFEKGDAQMMEYFIQVDAGTSGFAMVSPDDPRASDIGLGHDGTAYRAARYIYQPEHAVAIKTGGTDDFVVGAAGSATTSKAADAPAFEHRIDDFQVNPLDGTRYVGVKSTVWKFDEDYELQWKRRGPEPNGRSPELHEFTILRDGALAVGWSQDDEDLHKLVVYRPDGTIRWEKELQASPSGVACGPDNDMYYLESGRGVYRVDAQTGFSTWGNRSWGTDSHGGLTIAGGLLLAGDASDELLIHAFDTETGTLEKTIDTPFFSETLRAAPNGKVVLREYSGGRIASIDVATASTDWVTAVDDSYVHKPITVVPGGTGGFVYVGEWSGVSYADVADGVFTTDPDNGIHSAVAGEWGLYDTFGDLW